MATGPPFDDEAGPEDPGGAVDAGVELSVVTTEAEVAGPPVEDGPVAGVAGAAE